MTECNFSRSCPTTRAVRTHRLLLTLSAVLLVVAGGRSATTSAASPQQASISERAAADDVSALREVCTECHDLGMFVGQVRSREEWLDTLHKMVDLGARGTDEQFGHILHYLAENQTSVNVNTAPMDDVASALGVSESMAEAVMKRREERPFTDVADLLSVCGLDEASVRARQERIGF